MVGYKMITSFYAMLKLCRVYKKWKSGENVEYDIYQLIDLADFFPKYQIEQAIGVFDEKFQELILNTLLFKRFMNFNVRK